jgi:hypothetical protein
MFFASKQYEKCKINIFNKGNMKISYKHEHLVPETPEEMLVFCRENDYTFGMTYFCGVKNGFTTGFSIIKPHKAEAFICSTYEDESAIDIEKEISELTAAYNEWRQHVN